MSRSNSCPKTERAVVVGCDLRLMALIVSDARRPNERRRDWTQTIIMEDECEGRLKLSAMRG